MRAPVDLLLSTGVIRRLWDRRYLCRDDNVVSVPAEVLDGPAHNALGFTAGITLGGVEEVDACVKGGLEACEGVLVADMAAVFDCVSLAVGQTGRKTNR